MEVLFELPGDGDGRLLSGIGVSWSGTLSVGLVVILGLLMDDLKSSISLGVKVNSVTILSHHSSTSSSSMIDSVKSVSFALLLVHRNKKRIVSSIEDGSLSASYFSKISVSLSRVSRKFERIVSGFLFGASRKEMAKKGGMICVFLVETVVFVMVLFVKRSDHPCFEFSSMIALKVGTSA